MEQNLVSITLTDAELAKIDEAITTLEEFANRGISLSPDEIRSIPKMGDKSKPFARQTAVVLEQNLDILPPSFPMADFEQDLKTYDALTPRALRLQEVHARMQDTMTGLGSDIIHVALEGYALMKMFGKSEGLDSLRQAMTLRRPPTPHKPPTDKS